MNPAAEQLSSASHASRFILGARVDVTSYALSCQLVIAWAKHAESRYVCAANVHMVMEAYDKPSFRKIVNNADLVTPDGVPLVWMLQKLGVLHQKRVYGPDLTLHVLEAAAQQELSVGFHGGSPEVLNTLLVKIRKRFPRLQIPYAYSPPFRPLTIEEDQVVVNEINIYQPRILFVGLGCPKQERWMAEHKEKIQTVMLGVGAAFDFHAGVVPQAPAWMQNLGLEWFFRLGTSPKRLWRRYLYHNPRFLALAALQLSGLRSFEP